MINSFHKIRPHLHLILRKSLLKTFGLIKALIGLAVLGLIVYFLFQNWQWSLFFGSSSLLIIGLILQIHQIIHWKAWPFTVLIIFGFLTLWGFYCAYVPYNVYTLIFVPIVLILPLLSILVALKTNVYFYTKMLQTHSSLDYSYWLEHPKRMLKVDWNNIFDELNTKGIILANQYFVYFWWNRKKAQKEVPVVFEKTLMDHWISCLEGEDEYRFNPPPTRNNIRLASFILFTLAPHNLSNWLAMMIENPKYYRLLNAFFYHFELSLNEYIQSPEATIFLEEEDAERFSLEQIELIYQELPDLSRFPKLKENVEISKGLLILCLAMHQELEGLETI
jgi:hypothetical protein